MKNPTRPTAPILSLRTALFAGLALIAATGVAADSAESTTSTAHAGYHSAMVKSMSTMAEHMSAHNMTGNPDKDFLLMMIPHHQGAVDMAKIQVKYGKDPALIKMAQTIIDSQEKEIKDMEDHLKRYTNATTSTATTASHPHAPLAAPYDRSDKILAFERCRPRAASPPKSFSITSRRMTSR